MAAPLRTRLAAATAALVLCPCLAAGSHGDARARGAARHAQAHVDDARSHGMVGDARLSLNEAIQLGNGTLLVTQLSLAEQQRVQGFGDVAFAVIDAALVPVITLERDLDAIVDAPTWHGFQVVGTDGQSAGRRPRLDLNGHRGFVATGTFTTFVDLVLAGGSTGITIVQHDTVYGSSVEGCTFSGQTRCGVHVLLPGDGGKTTRIDLLGNTYVGLPQAVLIEDLGRDRTGQVRLHREHVSGGGVGHAVLVDGEGGELRLDLDAVQYSGTALALALLSRNAAASRTVTLDARFVHADAAAGAGSTAVRCDGVANGTTTLVLSQCDLAASAHALRFGPTSPSAASRLVLQDSRLGGAIDVRLRGPASTAVVRNVRARGGAWKLEVHGGRAASVTIADSILDGVALQCGGDTAVVASGVRCIGGSATGTATAPLAIARSHLVGVALGAHVTVALPLPQPHLGHGEVAPAAPLLGGRLTLLADLPAGLAGTWLLGNATTTAPLDLPRVRIWFDTGSPFPIVAVAAGVRLQQQVVLPIPNDAALRGLPDWFAQLVVVPDAGLAAPPLNAPPGRRFTFR